MIKDSGARTEFASGAVRDMKGEDKGRCDLLPLDVVYEITGHHFFKSMYNYVNTGEVAFIQNAIDDACKGFFGGDTANMLLQLSLHFKDGCEKYGENNWKKGIPEWSYIDSAIRHYIKASAGIPDEPHHRACVWNLVCLWWTHEHITEGENDG